MDIGDRERAERALDFLEQTASDIKPICRQARQKSHMVKWLEALLVKEMENRNLSISLREKYARADQRYIDACNEEAEAWAEWISLQEQRDTAKIAISLYQSMVKDRL